MRTRTRREPISQFRSPNRRTRAPHMGGGAVPRGGVCFTQNIFFLLSIILGFMAPLADRKRHKDANKWTFKWEPRSRRGVFRLFFFLIFSVEGRGDGGLNDRTAKVQEVYFSVFAFFYIRAASLNFNYNMLSASVCIRVTAAISKATHSHTHTHARDTRRSMTSPQLLAHSTDHIPQSLWPEAYTI